MIESLRAFLSRTMEPLALESYKVEHELEPYWMGRPAKGPYALHMAAALACGLVAIFLYLSRSAPSVAVLLAGLMVALLYPFVAARDWFETEYLLTPDVIVAKAGAFAKGIRVHDLARYTAVEEETPRFAQRLGYRNLHLRVYEDDGKLSEIQDEARVANVPAEVAQGFLDVLDILGREPEAVTEAQETVMTSPKRPAEFEST